MKPYMSLAYGNGYSKSVASFLGSTQLFNIHKKNRDLKSIKIMRTLAWVAKTTNLKLSI